MGLFTQPMRGNVRSTTMRRLFGDRARRDRQEDSEINCAPSIGISRPGAKPGPIVFSRGMPLERAASAGSI
jgi:hypothetical protein